VTKIIKYLMTALFVVGAASAVFYKFRHYVENPWTRDGQVRAKVIQITPRISGPVVKLEVVDNQFVKTGQLLFQIDQRTFEANLAQAQAEYDQAVNSYHATEKQVEAAQAQVEVSQGAVAQARSSIKELDSQIEKDKAEYGRQQELLPKRATSQKSVDRAKANYNVSLEQRQGALAGLAQSQAALLQSKAALAEAQANLGLPGEANASIRAAKAAVHQAELNLEFTRVTAPADGYITNLNLRVGSQAVSNQPVIALVDSNSYWIVGYFKETQVRNLNKGDKATVTLMSYPGRPLDGTVDSLGWGVAQQDGSTGFELLPTISPTFDWIRLAQRIPVKIYLTEVPSDIALRVGTTASVMVAGEAASNDK
jgi:multidrug resistance efflux pump